MINILAIDTSTDYCSVSLFNDGRVISKIFKKQKSNISTICEIENVFNKSKVSRNQINYLSYGVGPGSFVGVRIGAAIVEAINLTIQCKILGFSSMYAIANGVFCRLKKTKIIVLLQCGKEKVYIGKYSKNYKNNYLDTISETCLKLKEIINNDIFQGKNYIVSNIDEKILGMRTDIKNCFPDTHTIFHYLIKVKKLDSTCKVHPIYL